jgi:glycosyltransferase involved in cell wall biosynthesis
MARKSPSASAPNAVVSAIIPCLEEEDAIAAVVAAVLKEGVSEAVVVDGGSRDHTVARAAAAGARIVIEPERGYGRAVQLSLIHI